MVEQPRHRDPLLVATTQRIPPLSRDVPSALALDDVGDIEEGEDVHQVGVSDSTCRRKVSDQQGEEGEGQ